jgi:hypothetical protein
MNHACPNNDYMWCAFHVGIELAWLRVDDIHTRKMEPIFPMLWEQNLETIKVESLKVGSQLSHKFFDCELMMTMGIVHLHC